MFFCSSENVGNLLLRVCGDMWSGGRSRNSEGHLGEPSLRTADLKNQSRRWLIMFNYQNNRPTVKVARKFLLSVARCCIPAFILRLCLEMDAQGIISAAT